MADFKPPRYVTVKVAAGAQVPVLVSARSLRVIECDSALIKVSIEGGDFTPINRGLAYVGLKEDPAFKSVSFRNDGATAATLFVVFSLDGRWEDSRLSVITGDEYLAITDPDTVLVGRDIITLAAGASVVLTGVPGAGQYRRSGVTVDNADAAAVLTIYDDTAKVAGFVLPGQSKYIPLSGEVEISNDTAGAISCAIAEIWQLVP